MEDWVRNLQPIDALFVAVILHPRLDTITIYDIRIFNPKKWQKIRLA